MKKNVIINAMLAAIYEPHRGTRVLSKPYYRPLVRVADTVAFAAEHHRGMQELQCG